MKKKKLTERVKNTLNDMFLESENIFGKKMSFEELNDALGEVIKNNPDFATTHYCVVDAFYLPNNTITEMTEKACKNLRSYWSWPRRTEMDENGHLIPDPEWVEYDKRRDGMLDKLEKKEITLKEYNKWLDMCAAKYHMVKRSWDKEFIKFNIFNYAPSCNKENMLKLKSQFDTVKDMAYEEIVDYIDKHHDEFGIIDNRENSSDIASYTTALQYKANYFALLKDVNHVFSLKKSLK